MLTTHATTIRETPADRLEVDRLAFEEESAREEALTRAYFELLDFRRAQMARRRRTAPAQAREEMEFVI